MVRALDELREQGPQLPAFCKGASAIFFSLFFHATVARGCCSCSIHLVPPFFFPSPLPALTGDAASFDATFVIGSSIGTIKLLFTFFLPPHHSHCLARPCRVAAPSSRIGRANLPPQPTLISAAHPQPWTRSATRKKKIK